MWHLLWDNETQGNGRKGGKFNAVIWGDLGFVEAYLKAKIPEKTVISTRRSQLRRWNK
jgi:hypothetical protein